MIVYTHTLLIMSTLQDSSKTLDVMQWLKNACCSTGREERVTSSVETCRAINGHVPLGTDLSLRVIVALTFDSDLLVYGVVNTACLSLSILQTVH